MICLSLGNIDYGKIIKTLSFHDFFELRFDLLNLSNNEIISILKQPKIFIAAYRNSKAKEENVLSILTTAIESGAKYIDIDLDTSHDFKKKVLHIAKHNAVKIIISYHNYIIAPSVNDMINIIRKCFYEGANIAKVACLAQGPKDLGRIISLYEDIEINQIHREKPYNDILAIPMGEKFSFMRALLPKFGAPFTYCSLNEDNKTAPGQLSLEKMKKISLIFDEIS